MSRRMVEVQSVKAGWIQRSGKAWRRVERLLSRINGTKKGKAR